MEKIKNEKNEKNKFLEHQTPTTNGNFFSSPSHENMDF